MKHLTLPLALLAAIGLAGCPGGTPTKPTPSKAPPASAAPATASPAAGSPTPGPTATPTPGGTPAPGGTPTPAATAATGSGSVRGKVTSKPNPGGGIAPLGGVVVHVGSLDVLSAYPDDAAVLAVHELEPAYKDLPRLVVMHDFGAGAVAAERRLRAHPTGTERYVYLQEGEYWAEDVPAGSVSVSAEQGGASAPAQQVAVQAGQTATPPPLVLDVVPTSAVEDKRVPKVLSLVKLDPNTVTVSKTATGFKTAPDPAVLTVKLAAPAGSAGAVIAGVNVGLTWAGADKKPHTYSYRVLQRVIAAPAGAWGLGTPATLTVPLDVTIMGERAFSADKPTQLEIDLEFIDDAGFAIQDLNFKTLTAKAVILAN